AFHRKSLLHPGLAPRRQPRGHRAGGAEAPRHARGRPRRGRALRDAVRPRDAHTRPGPARARRAARPGAPRRARALGRRRARRRARRERARSRLAGRLQGPGLAAMNALWAIVITILVLLGAPWSLARVVAIPRGWVGLASLLGRLSARSVWARDPAGGA